MAKFTVPLSDEFKISVGQARLICECLNMAKSTLKEITPSNIIVESTIKLKIESINKLLPIIERSAQYDFDQSVSKCRNGQCKNENIGDVGQDVFTIMANRKGTVKDETVGKDKSRVRGTLKDKTVGKDKNKVNGKDKSKVRGTIKE